MPIPRDYQGAAKQHLYDRPSPYDFGFMLINHNAKRALAANGIVPLNEGNWSHQDGVNFSIKAWLDFPPKL